MKKNLILLLLLSLTVIPASAKDYKYVTCSPDSE